MSSNDQKTANGDGINWDQHAWLTLIREHDIKNILAHLEDNDDKQAHAAVTMCMLTGARLSEIPEITVTDCDEIVIPTHDDQSEDASTRRIRLIGEPLRQAKEALPNLPSPSDIQGVEKRLGELTEVLVARRKFKPTFAAMRHHVGSELLESRLDKDDIAYIMGHQSADGLEEYEQSQSKSNAKVPYIEPAHKEPTGNKGWANKKDSAPPPRPTFNQQSDEYQSFIESAHGFGFGAYLLCFGMAIAVTSFLFYFFIFLSVIDGLFWKIAAIAALSPLWVTALGYIAWFLWISIEFLVVFVYKEIRLFI
ncbi:site-specific integrase [Aquisalimonas asiatica]|uniref:Phage integrase family protein n=1 Tax=Aquisalimonas asiatica TaxID=406100 RepID=A0A1H8QTT6_9GAMM|nr:site-specific integrase [Aquisalimonas asiatica]SEO57650.1 Phage integrase family protein [Aquisalimonas asiatica]